MNAVNVKFSNEQQIMVLNKDVPAIVPYVEEYGGYMFYIGLGMAVLVLLILICYVLALFCGFCGKRPGKVIRDSVIFVTRFGSFCMKSGDKTH